MSGDDVDTRPQPSVPAFQLYADQSLRPDFLGRFQDDLVHSQAQWAEPAPRRGGLALSVSLAVLAGTAVIAWSMAARGPPAPPAPAPRLSVLVAATPPAPSVPPVQNTPIPTVPSDVEATIAELPPTAPARPPPPVQRQASLAPPAATARLRPLPPLPFVTFAPPPASRPAEPSSPPTARAVETASSTAAGVASAYPGPPPPRGVDCRHALTRSQRMVCDDPELADADRRMQNVYGAALAAGAPEDELRADQEDWQGIREEAAGHSRRAVMSVYAQRIEELARVANGGPLDPQH